MDISRGENDAQKYPCSSCFVGVGQPCITKSGRVTTPHRFRLADGLAFTVLARRAVRHRCSRACLETANS